MTRIKIERDQLVNSEQGPGNGEIIIPKVLLPLEREILMLASTIDPETGKPISLFLSFWKSFSFFDKIDRSWQRKHLRNQPQNH